MALVMYILISLGLMSPVGSVSEETAIEIFNENHEYIKSRVSISTLEGITGWDDTEGITGWDDTE